MKAVAGEAQVPFFSYQVLILLRCLGVGASRVRDLSNKQKKNHQLLF
jgi:ATP-dependent Zn protease